MFTRGFIKQILSGQHPSSEIKSEKPELRILKMITDGCGPQRPDDHPVIIDSHWDIIQRCLLPRPKLRPPANEVLDLVKSTILFYNASRSVDRSPPVFARTQPRNFIIFGEMGVGKSALVNLIAGEQLAKSSSGTQSCTLESTEYPIRLSDPMLNVNLFDTVNRRNDLQRVGVLIQKQSRLAWTAPL
jgi:serine/threonine protein kinase